MGTTVLPAAGSLSQVGLGLAVVLGLALYGGYLAVALRRAKRRTAHGILTHLTETGRPFTVRASYLSGVWDPSRPAGPANQLFLRGFATYWLDADGQVNLRLHQPDGTMHRRQGPVPDWFHSPSAAQLRRRHLVHWVLAAYAVVVVIGFGLGCGLAGGTVDHRAAGGLVGLVVAMVVVAIGGQAFQVGRAVTGLRTRRKT